MLTLEEHWFLLLGWLQTTVVSLMYLKDCVRRCYAIGVVHYVQDLQNIIDLTYNLGQVVVLRGPCTLRTTGP